MSRPPENLSLLVLDEDADLARVADTIDRLDGDVFHLLPPRLIVARVAPGSDEVLGQLGVARRFDGAVGKGELADASAAERRFATVFSDRYYPEQLPPEVREALRPASIATPTIHEGGTLDYGEEHAALHEGFAPSDAERERAVFVPYAAGKVVVSVWLPESNGESEPSTEDWNETLILQTYEKIQTALEAVKRHGPAGDMEFILHYESSPDNGGLEGTIDTTWEFGKQAQWGQWQQKNVVVAEMLSRLLDREVTTSDLWTANQDYLNALRDQYDADAAFYIMVAANGNGTAGLRAHASFHGPSTTLSSSNGWNVFMHEFGHIFGARDEYCPDACISPTSLAGYLGMINANSRFREGDVGGINNGKGEDQPSLMMYNAVNEVNGYTRGAWGWLDTDGDGLFDVVDTFPRTEVEASIDRDGQVRLVGNVTDVPETRWAGIEFSINRIRALQYRFADIEDSPWLEVALPADTRGRQAVDVSIGQFTSGEHNLEVRAVNSVGNVEPVAQPVAFDVRDLVGNTAPHLSVAADSLVGSTASTFTLTAQTVDLDGDAVTVTFETDGNGTVESLETVEGSAPQAAVRFARAGAYVVRVEATDARGASATTDVELLVARDNTPPRASFVAASPVQGSSSLPAAFRVASAEDREGGPLEFNWIAEVETMNQTGRTETGFAADNTTFETLFNTPLGLVTDGIDLTAGDEDLASAPVFDTEVVRDGILAIALGAQGIALVDISDRQAPQLLSRLELGVVARNLKVRGDRLLVLGRTLTLVDISDLSAPRELRQYFATSHNRVAVNDRPSVIDERFGGWHGVGAPWDEPIVGLGIRVTIDHPNHSELRLELEAPRSLGLRPIVLMDGDSDTSGERTYVFNLSNTPALEAVQGAFAMDWWNLRVTDTVANGQTGTVVGTRMRFRTRHRAVEVLPGATEIVGTVGNRYILIAGEGLQVLDARWTSWIRSTSTITGTGYLGAAAVGDTLIVLSPLEKRGGEEELIELGEPRAAGAPGEPEPETRGLYAVSLRSPHSPRLVRMDDEVQANSLVFIGGRMYLHARRIDEPLPPGLIPVPLPVPLPPRELKDIKRPAETTLIGDPRSFVLGRDYVLGEFEGVVSRNAFGDESEVWTSGLFGRLQRLDVSDPANARVTQEFSNPPAWNMKHLGGREVLFANGAFSLIANLDNTMSKVSRVFRVTLETRDAQGAIGRTTRAIHLVPYNNPPSVDGVEIVRGSTDRDQWELRVLSSDADGTPTWDPNRFIRIDYDGDGRYDTDWLYAQGRDGTYVYTSFPEPGEYTLHFQVRDGFWATSTAEFDIEVLPWVPVDCTADEDCVPGEFCRFDDEDTCGSEGATGVCEQPWRECTEQYEPVCGCDGRTYDNPCIANQRGTSVDYAGECEYAACGGRTGGTCPDAQYCSYRPEDICGRADAPGVCAPRPEICLFPRPGDEVCGCDDRTYGSACEAASQGVAILRAGPCEPPDDCRTNGCRDGDECLPCGFGFQCLPEGTVCRLPL